MKPIFIARLLCMECIHSYKALNLNIAAQILKMTIQLFPRASFTEEESSEFDILLLFA